MFHISFLLLAGTSFGLAVILENFAILLFLGLSSSVPARHKPELQL